MELIKLITFLSVIVTLILIIRSTLVMYPNLFKQTSNHDEKSHSGLSNDAVDFVRIKIKPNDLDNPSINKYFQSLRGYVARAQNTINTIEYLPSNNVIQGLYQSQTMEQIGDEDNPNRLNVRSLLTKYDEYYKHVRNVVNSNDSLKYIRVLQITGWMRNKAGNSRIEIIKTALNLMPPGLVTHIGRMMNSPCSNRFKLYILTEPVVVYNYMIIDNDYVVSEYFRYNKEGVNFPDEMYVNKRSSISDQIDKRTKLFYEIIKNNEPVSREEFSESVKSLLLDNNNDKEYEIQKDAVLTSLKELNLN